jgi:glycine C-acetyltransferase
VFVSGIVFPTVALGKGRLRVMISASHTKADLDEALLAFAKVGKALQVLR